MSACRRSARSPRPSSRTSHFRTPIQDERAAGEIGARAPAVLVGCSLAPFHRGPLIRLAPNLAPTIQRLRANFDAGCLAEPSAKDRFAERASPCGATGDSLWSTQSTKLL